MAPSVVIVSSVAGPKARRPDMMREVAFMVGVRERKNMVGG